MDDLWRFSLNAWRLPGVERVCLQLQDQHDAEVALLLAAAWNALQGVTPDPSLLVLMRAPGQHWRSRLDTLRTLRREASSQPHWQEWKRLLADAELEAERLLLEDISQQLQARPRDRTDVCAVLEWLLLAVEESGDNPQRLALLSELADLLLAQWPQGFRLPAP